MASNLVEKSSVNLNELTSIIWGDNIKQDVFERWCQGFIFDSEKEPTALLQYSGGPCSIIATVQAFLLRQLLFESKCGDDWQHPTGLKLLLCSIVVAFHCLWKWFTLKLAEEELNTHLMNSFMSIFINISTPDSKYLVVYEEKEQVDQKQESNQQESEQAASEKENTEASAVEHTAKRMRLDHDGFLKKLNVYKFETLNEMKVLLSEKIGLFKQDYGVLCFLYSLLLTKVNNIFSLSHSISLY